MQRRSLIIASGLAAASSILGRPTFAQGAQITGAGATFPNPVYQKWAEAGRAATGITVNYQSVGSGAGQNQIKNRTVDFGASDAPLTVAQLTEGNLLQFPSVMGSLVPIVNIPGIENEQLKLTGEVVADIYLGRIAKWNDPRIVALNEGLALPNLAIAPAYRADGSARPSSGCPTWPPFPRSGSRRSASAPRSASPPAPARAATRASPAR